MSEATLQHESPFPGIPDSIRPRFRRNPISRTTTYHAVEHEGLDPGEFHGVHDQIGTI
jgi:hypothetical protein